MIFWPLDKSFVIPVGISILQVICNMYRMKFVTGIDVSTTHIFQNRFADFDSSTIVNCRVDKGI